MTRKLKRDGLLVQVRTHGEGVDVTQYRCPETSG